MFVTNNVYDQPREAHLAYLIKFTTRLFSAIEKHQHHNFS